MKRRKRPIDDTVYRAMLYGVVMNVIGIPLQIVFIANRAFPIPPLSQVMFTSGVSGQWNAARLNRTRESALDRSPLCEVIAVTLWQRPHRMQMIGQESEK